MMYEPFKIRGRRLRLPRLVAPVVVVGCAAALTYWVAVRLRSVVSVTPVQVLSADVGVAPQHALRSIYLPVSTGPVTISGKYRFLLVIEEVK